MYRVVFVRPARHHLAQVQKKKPSTAIKTKKEVAATAKANKKKKKPPTTVPLVQPAKKEAMKAPAARTTKPDETDTKLPTGWKVEVSCRSSGKTKADKYYVSPDRKTKCRSFREIVEYMST